jgi:uncharacterized membrane protein
MNSKNVVLSKTVWGGIIALLPQVLQMFGIDAPDGIAEQLMGVIGFILVIWGRFTAKTSLTVKPQ